MLAAIALLFAPVAPADVGRFPDLGPNAYGIYTARRDWLLAQAMLYPAESNSWYRQANECERARQAVSLLSDMRSCPEDIMCRRQQLEDLRKHLGRVNYAAGVIPWPWRTP